MYPWTKYLFVLFYYFVIVLWGILQDPSGSCKDKTDLNGHVMGWPLMCPLKLGAWHSFPCSPPEVILFWLLWPRAQFQWLLLVLSYYTYYTYIYVCTHTHTHIFCSNYIFRYQHNGLELDFNTPTVKWTMPSFPHIVWLPYAPMLIRRPWQLFRPLSMNGNMNPVSKSLQNASLPPMYS